MVKTVRLEDETHKRLYLLTLTLSLKQKKRLSFDEVINQALDLLEQKVAQEYTS